MIVADSSPPSPDSPAPACATAIPAQQQHVRGRRVVWRRLAVCRAWGGRGAPKRKKLFCQLLPEQTEKREAKTAREIFELPVRGVSSTRRSDLVNLTNHLNTYLINHTRACSFNRHRRSSLLHFCCTPQQRLRKTSISKSSLRLRATPAMTGLLLSLLRSKTYGSRIGTHSVTRLEMNIGLPSSLPPILPTSSCGKKEQWQLKESS